jgi:hypothetical protein
MARYPLRRQHGVIWPPPGRDIETGEETPGAFRAALRALLDWKSDPIAAYVLLRTAEAMIAAELRASGRPMRGDHQAAPDTQETPDATEEA